MWDILSGEAEICAPSLRKGWVLSSGKLVKPPPLLQHLNKWETLEKKVPGQSERSIDGNQWVGLLYLFFSPFLSILHMEIMVAEELNLTPETVVSSLMEKDVH